LTIQNSHLTLFSVPLQLRPHYLGMSTRTLERYVNDGWLSVRYEKSVNGQIALFDPNELDQLKEQKQIPRIKPAAIGSELAPTSSDINLSSNVGGLFTWPLKSSLARGSEFISLNCLNVSSNRFQALPFTIERS
jgi:hypothetical protein